MDWLYKSKKYPVTFDNVLMMQDAVKTVMKNANNLSSACLYKDMDFFYIKTNNRVALNHFFFQNGFEEMEEEKSLRDLKLLFGSD